MGEDPLDMHPDDYNEEKTRHYEFGRSFEKGDFHVLCPTCKGKMEWNGHMIYTSRFPMRQAICKGCHNTVYLYV